MRSLLIKTLQTVRISPSSLHFWKFQKRLSLLPFFSIKRMLSEPCAITTFYRQEICSNTDKLEELHQKHHWIPGAANIRPLPNQIHMKLEDIEEIHRNWNSMEDYLLFKVFGLDFSLNDAKKFAVTIPPSVSLQSLRKLTPNQYPYNNLSCYHYIMWYGTKARPYDSERITKDIEESLHQLVRKEHQESFQFVWYENPKMTVPEFYHVHVFWIPQ